MTGVCVVTFVGLSKPFSFINMLHVYNIITARTIVSSLCDVCLFSRLNAADVMNRDLKYIYPVSRVQSIEQLLRVTAHNAFFVVTPLSTGAANDRNARDRVFSVKPQLYKRASIHPVHPTKSFFGKEGNDSDAATPINLGDSEMPVINEEYIHETESSTGPFVLRGIILRSQLVTLIHNGVFFNEEDEVRERGGG